LKDKKGVKQFMKEINEKNVEQPVEKGSAIEKFHSAEDRDTAYAELEKEFTKRSQRLKDLELENGQLRAKQAEQEQQDQYGLEVDQFMEQFPEAVEFSAEMAEILEANPHWQGEDALLKAYVRVLSQKNSEQELLKEDEEFIHQAVKSNLGLRDRIVSEYFDAIPPSVKLPTGSGIPASTYKAPRTLQDAGKLLEDILRGR
jgi:hypothetical protein